MSVKPKLKPNIKTGITTMYVPINSSDEAMICLECPLPADICKPDTCNRYKEERAKILKKNKTTKKGK